MVILESDGIKGIKPEYKQIFKNMHTLNIGHKEIIKMKNNGVITERDLAITKFLFRFNFATAEQLHLYLNIIGENSGSVELIKRRLDKLVMYRVLNKFILVEDPEADHKGDFPKNALEIYCMDLGGRHLLAHYSNEETANWYTVQTMKTSELVKKELFITRFYIQLMYSSGDKVRYFNINPEMRVGRQAVIPSFEFSLDDNGRNIYYLGEVVLDIDLPVEFRSKSFKLESLLSTRGWMKYFHDIDSSPPLLIVAESDFVALDSSRLFYRATEISKFRVTTFDRMEKPFYENGVFMKYIDRIEELEAVTSSKFKRE